MNGVGWGGGDVKGIRLISPSLEEEKRTRERETT